MKATHLLKSLFLLTLTTFVGCMENDVYDPNSKKDNGNFTDLVIPSDFTWSTTTKVAVNVITGDKSDYTYTILIYPQAATEETLPLIAKDATKDTPLNTEIIVPASDTIVSVVKTMKYNSGATLRVECTAPIIDGRVNVDFGNMGTPTTRAMQVTTRGISDEIKDDLKKWDEMTELEADEELVADKMYKVTKETSIKELALNKSTGIKIYVSGTLALESGITMNNANKGGKIIVLGKGIKSNDGGTLISDGDIELKNGLMIQNYGNINIAGTFIIRDDCEVETEGCINAKRIEMSEQGQGALLDIKEGGYVHAETMYMEKAKVELEKNAYLHVDNELTFKNDNEIDGESTKSSIVEIGSIAKVQGQTNKDLEVGDAYIVCKENKPKYVELDDAFWGNRDAAANAGVKTEGSNCENFNPSEDPSGGTESEDQFTSLGKFTYAFEDMWPNYGDYDMNDLVLETNTTLYVKSNYVSKALLNFKITAIGAVKNIAAAIQLDKINPSDIVSVEYDTNNNFSENLFQIQGNGTEQTPKLAVIPLFDNAHTFSGVKGITGTKENSTFAGKEFKVTITFKDKSITQDKLALDQWNYFIACNATQGKRMEIHMIGKGATDLFNSSAQEGGVASSNDPFKTKDNFCWVMQIPGEFSFPLEGQDIRKAYPNIEKWITEPIYPWYNK